MLRFHFSLPAGYMVLSHELAVASGFLFFFFIRFLCITLHQFRFTASRRLITRAVTGNRRVSRR